MRWGKISAALVSKFKPPFRLINKPRRIFYLAIINKKGDKNMKKIQILFFLGFILFCCENSYSNVCPTNTTGSCCSPGSEPFYLNSTGISNVGYPFDNTDWACSAGSSYHKGDDCYATDWNRYTSPEELPVYPLCPGTVIYKGCLDAWAYGDHIIVQCRDNPNFAFVYAHLKKNSIPVEINGTVEFNTQIGVVGDSYTDCSEHGAGVHLHAALWKNIK